ncbi:hypothetical protein PtB15_7B250 [Puccinia triticina]|nr:hypothetical protein PtB15_7B250 [Puccinia triticina]
MYSIPTCGAANHDIIHKALPLNSGIALCLSLQVQLLLTIITLIPPDNHPSKPLLLGWHPLAANS